MTLPMTLRRFATCFLCLLTMKGGRASQNAAVSPQKRYKTRAFACDEELVRSAFQSYDVSEQGLNVREALSLVSRVPRTHSVPARLTVCNNTECSMCLGLHCHALVATVLEKFEC